MCLGGLSKDLEVGYMTVSGLMFMTLVLIMVLLQLMTY